jgi:excisionase family DNA binding protein
MEKDVTNVETTDLLTVRDTCKKLRVSRWTVQKLIASGRLASVKIGRRRLITRDALAAYVNDLKNEGD